ncbi:MAG TPA: UbiX family flavin prenyltransferase, partial [Geobacteraceae bacterium]
MKERHIVLAFTGASGAAYGLRLGRELLRAGVSLSVLISAPGFLVLKEECGLDWTGEPAEVQTKVAAYLQGEAETRVAPPVHYYAADDFLAPFASGSRTPDAMVVCPCTMGSLARIAGGLSDTLLERTADVMLKEGRPLVLVPRETPLSAIHLENMLKL